MKKPEVKDFYDDMDPRGMSTSEHNDYMIALKRWEKIDSLWSYVDVNDRRRIESGDITEQEFDRIYQQASDDAYDHGIYHATMEARRKDEIKKRKK